jgi:hypothetical protein
LSYLLFLIFLSRKYHFYQEFHEDGNLVTRTLSISTAVYSICYGKKVASSVSDGEIYIIIRKLIDYIFHTFTVFISQWEIHTHLQRNLHKVTYKGFDIP